MRDKPDYCYESGCPLAEKGRGFVLGSGNTAARVGLILEAPGREEVEFQLKPVEGRRFFSTQEEIDAELERRKKRYPDVPLEFLKRGAPVVGRTGSMLNQWILPQGGIKREEVFIDNVLRCLPPKVKDKQYPVGKDRAEAERCCRYYDRLDEFAPDALVATLHPAALMREITPLPLMITDVGKAKDFSSQGLKTLILMGGKSAKAFLRYGENVSRWRGSYELVGKDWYATVLKFFSGEAGEKGKRKKREIFAEDPNDPLSFLGGNRLKRVKYGARTQCTGRIASGEQCTKQAKAGEVLCGVHLKKAMKDSAETER